MTRRTEILVNDREITVVEISARPGATSDEIVEFKPDTEFAKGFFAGVIFTVAVWAIATALFTWVWK